MANPAPTDNDPQAPRKHQRRLQALGKVGRSHLRIAAICAVLSGSLLIAQAALIALAMQRVFVEQHSLATVTGLLGGWIGIALLRAALVWLGQRNADTAAMQVRHDLRKQLLHDLSARGPRWLRRQRSGELAELAGTHVEAIGQYFSGFAITRIEVMVLPLVFLIAAFKADVAVALILLVTLPLIPIFMALAGRGAEAASRRQLQAMTRLGGHFADRLRGLGLIRLYGRGAAEIDGVRKASEDLRERTMKVLRMAFLSSAVLEFFASLSVAMVAVYLGLTYLGMLHLRGDALSLGTGVFCLLLAPEFYAPLRRLAAQYHDRAAALAALSAIEESAVAGAACSRDAAGMTSVTAASRSHKDNCLILQRNDRLALIGPSGCGKSTLLEALLDWLPHDTLPVGFDNKLRVAYAPQRPRLFHGSIADNLRIAAPKASDAQLHTAARSAQVLRFVEHLPDGLDTVIGEGGFGLSGGEARRVALARALLMESEVLLLDEPTAFLDADTERDLLAALDEIARERIVIIATHSEAAMHWAGRALRLPGNTLEVMP
ncbi:MAG: thiol reductant ABC exporter subunit CydD [Pseudoxanthomonas sp.]